MGLVVTDSSMQTTAPQARNREAGPLKQAEGQGGRNLNSDEYSHVRRVWGNMSAGQTGQTGSGLSGVVKNGTLIDDMLA